MEAPMSAQAQQDRDAQHLDLLALLHTVCAAVIGLFSLFPLIHVGLGIAMVTGKMAGASGDEAFVGWVFIAVGACIILAGETIALLVYLAGRRLKRRQGYTFCIVVAGIACLFMPVGTALGVFTLVVLMRPSVRDLFQGASVPH